MLNVLAALFALALVPLDTILAGANVLSVLAEKVCREAPFVGATVDHGLAGRRKGAPNLRRGRRLYNSVRGRAHRFVNDV